MVVPSYASYIESLSGEGLKITLITLKEQFCLPIESELFSILFLCNVCELNQET